MRLLHISLLLLSCLHHASAWSSLGHCAVGYIAEALFTDAASNLVNDLLQPDEDFDICDAAVWADKIKHTHEFAHTASWHFIDAADNPPEKCIIHFSTDCNRGKTPGCVVSAITAMTAQMGSSNTTLRQQALKFLLHFIGDIHQPLHTEGLATGGNDIFICFYDKCGSASKPMELHAIWDAEIPNKHRAVADSATWSTVKAAAKAWAEDLAVSAVPRVWNGADCTEINTAQKCALVWGGEANRWVCDYVLKDFPFQATSLGDEYFEGAVPVVDELIAKAGVRLGKWINALAEAVDEEEEKVVVVQSGDGEL